MPRYDVSILIHFTVDAPNSTDAKGCVNDLNIHKRLTTPDHIIERARYRRKGLISAKKVNKEDKRYR